MYITDAPCDTIIVGDAPQIPGLSFRRFRGTPDYPIMADIMRRSNAANQIDRSESVESLVLYFQHLTNCNPYEDMLFVEVYGSTIGYSRVWWVQETEGTRIYVHTGYLLPEWWHKGIGRTMLRYNERRLREIAATHPLDGPRVFETEADSNASATDALLHREGYQAAREFYDMVRTNLDDIPDMSLPVGLEIRPVCPEHYRAIWEAEEEAFHDHWGFSPASEADYLLWLKDIHFDPSLWHVAWDADTIAGQVRGYIDMQENAEFKRTRGYTEGISVRRLWRKRGLSRALLLMSLKALKARGMTEVALTVDAESDTGALRLYESCGFCVTRRTLIYHKPME